MYQFISMKQYLTTLIAATLLAATAHAQLPTPALTNSAGGSATFIYGLWGGGNTTKVSAPFFTNTGSRLGYHAGIYADNSFGRFTGMRNELSYAKQGFRFHNAYTNGNVDLRYLYVTNLFALNIGHLLQVHAGPQVGLLLNALADTVHNLNGSTATSFFSIKGQASRLNLGGCAGLEVYPWKGLIVGVRYNLGFLGFNNREADANTIYSRRVASGSSTRLLTEMLQLSCGWRLGTASR